MGGCHAANASETTCIDLKIRRTTLERRSKERGRRQTNLLTKMEGTCCSLLRFDIGMSILKFPATFWLKKQHENLRSDTVRIGFGYLAAGAVALCVGCRDPRGPAVVSSDDPDLKITAIHTAVARGDETDVAIMVSDLQSDDPAIRFYAIQGLRRLTHNNFGYRYYDDDDSRAPATAHWQQWLKEQPQK